MSSSKLLPIQFRDRTVAELLEEYKSNGVITPTPITDAHKNNGVVDEEKIAADTDGMGEFEKVCYLNNIYAYYYDPDLYDFGKLQ